jgi:ankyrin repeat protein
MKSIILAIFLGFVLLFGCTGQTNNQSTGPEQASPPANNQTPGHEIYTGDLVKLADSNYTALDFAKSLIENGADVNATDTDGRTVLMHAIITNQTDIAMLLIAKGADVNARGPSEVTPLMLAAENGETDVVTLLIDDGADVNAVNSYGLTVLMYAKEPPIPKASNPEIVNLLVKAGAK